MEKLKKKLKANIMHIVLGIILVAISLIDITMPVLTVIFVFGLLMLNYGVIRCAEIKEDIDIMKLKEDEKKK